MASGVKTRFLLSVLSPALILIIVLYAFNQVVFASDASVNEAPQSVMQTEQEFDETNANRGSIDKVEFLNVEGLDAQTIENVMANAEFQAQVEDLRRSGSPLPAMSVLVALFVMGSLSLGGSAGSGRSYVNVPLGRKLSDFFRVDKVPRVVTKMVDVVKKVPVYTTRVVKETLSRVVKVPRQVAYTAYKTVREVTHKTRTWVENIVKYKYVSHIEKMEKQIRFIEKYMDRTNPRTQRSISMELRNLKSNLREIKMSEGQRMSGRARQRLNQFRYRTQYALGSIASKIIECDGHGSKSYCDLREKYQKEVEGKYTVSITRKVTEPVVNFVQKAYTAFRTEYDVKTETYVEERTVTDVSYKDVVEQKEVKETVYDNKITPLSEKIGLALNYVRNLKRIKAKPANRDLKDTLRNFDRGSVFQSASRKFKNISAALDQAMRDPSTETVEWKAVPVQNYNAFIKGLKTEVYRIRQSENPMAAMFGQKYIQAIVDGEAGIKRYAEIQKKAMDRKIKLLELYATGKISKDYYRTQYDNCKEKARQARTNAAKLRDKIADRKAWYTRKFHDTLDQIDRLAYLKDTKTWKEILTKTNITFGIKHLSPELAVNASKKVFARADLEKAGGGRVISEKVLGSSNPVARTYRKVKKFSGNVVEGTAKGLGQNVVEASHTGEQYIIKPLGRLVTPKKYEKKLGFSADTPTASEQLNLDQYLTSDNNTQAVAKFISEWGLLGGVAGKTGKGIQTGVKTFRGHKAITQLHTTTSSKNIVQPVNNLDEIYNLADNAKMDFSTQLNSIAGKTKGLAYLADLKLQSRVLEKVGPPSGKGVETVSDILRGSLVFDKMSDLQSSIFEIQKTFNVVKVKNRLTIPKANGYRDVNVLVKQKNGVLGEVQLHVKSIFDAKMGKGTELYNKKRQLQQQIKDSQGVLKEKLASNLEKIKQKETKLYEEAWKNRKK